MKFCTKLKAVIFCLAAAGSLALHGNASAGVIYSEDFNGMTLGDGLDDSSASWNGSAGDYTVEAAGAGTVFTDQHLELTAPDTNFNFANRDDGAMRPVVSFSIDLVDLGTNTSTDAGVRLAIRRSTGSVNTTATAAGTADSTIVHYDVVLNASAAPVLYQDGVTSIAANTFEVWIDGVLASSGAANGSGDSIGVGLWNRRPDAAFLADNLVVHDMAVFTPVPEPTGLVLLLGMICTVINARRRTA